MMIISESSINYDINNQPALYGDLFQPVCPEQSFSGIRRGVWKVSQYGKNDLTANRMPWDRFFDFSAAPVKNS